MLSFRAPGELPVRLDKLLGAVESAHRSNKASNATRLEHLRTLKKKRNWNQMIFQVWMMKVKNTTRDNLMLESYFSYLAFM